MDASNESWRQLLRDARRQRDLTHYEVLSIAQDADEAAIKKAYVLDPSYYTPLFTPLYTFIAVHTPMYIRYTCIYTIHTPNTPLNTP